MKERKILCVTSSKPATALTAGGGGCLTLVSPNTTSVFSSLHVAGDMSGKVGVGLASLTFFPTTFGGQSSHNNVLAMGYGYTTKNKDDSYAMLLTIRQATLPPILHWKTRLPEGHLSGGITISPCGHYAMGGGSSGNIYVWNTLGGTLLRVVKAHYRPVTHMTWTSAAGAYLATGGEDGMVHIFDTSDLVDSNVDASPCPIRTWSQHHLPITGLVALSDNRLASASSDGKILLLHVPSQKVMATIQMPRKATTLMADANNTLYVGSTQGVISIIRLDEYAMHKLSQQQGMTVHHSQQQTQACTVDQVFGTPAVDSPSHGDSQGVKYQTELKGHDRSVTCLTMLNNESLCSGDESGCVRIWDLESKICLHVTRPWSTSLNDTKSSSHPVSSIWVLSQSDEVEEGTAGMLAGINKQQLSKSQPPTSLVPLVTPLQKFRDTPSNGQVYLPVWNNLAVAASPTTTNVELSIETLLRRRRQRKEQRKRQKIDKNAAENPSLRIGDLEQQLQEARETIQRWEAVNNKLMTQLQSKIVK